MKKLFTLISASAMLLVYSESYSQCALVINPSTDTLNCGGGTFTLQAVSSGGGTFALANDFNLGNAGTGWTLSPAGTFTNPCGPSFDGTTYMWMGDQTAAPRTLQTAPLDVACGGDICFDFRMSIQGDVSPCEGPDLAGEGIYLEWSIDGGATFTQINYFQPNTNGCFNASNTGGSGCDGDYTAWANYCFPIPPAAQTTTTIFKWWQSGSSGNLFDHWGIDNVAITSNNCQGYYYDWAHIPGSNDDSLITETITATTTFDVLYTNGIDDTCYASITIVVDTTIGVTPNITHESCDDADNAAITTTLDGGFAPYTYVLSGPSTQNNNTGNFAPLPDGNYTLAVTDNIGCYGEVVFDINPGNPLSGNAATSAETCLGYNDGSVVLNGTGGIAPYNYSITGPTSGNNTSGTFNNLPDGNYVVTVTDPQGCEGTFNFTIAPGATVNTTNNIITETCYLYNDAVANTNASGGSAPYTYILSGPMSDTSTTGTFSNLAAGNYTVFIADANGCLDTSTFTVVNAVEVVADFSANPTTGPAPMTVNFTNESTGANTYFWIFGDGNNSTQSNPTNTYVTETTFEVVLIASNGPCTDTARMEIVTLESYFTLPNVFSPNNDASNPRFEFKPKNVQTLNCRIYNRWGTLVAEINDPNGGWNGKDDKGKDCPDGVYYYVLDIVTLVPPTVFDPAPRRLEGTEFNFNGTVTLLRK